MFFAEEGIDQKKKNPVYWLVATPLSAFCTLQLMPAKHVMLCSIAFPLTFDHERRKKKDNVFILFAPRRVWFRATNRKSTAVDGCRGQFSLVPDDATLVCIQDRMVSFDGQASRETLSFISKGCQRTGHEVAVLQHFKSTLFRYRRGRRQRRRRRRESARRVVREQESLGSVATEVDITERT